MATQTTQFSVTLPLPLGNGWKDFGETYSAPTVSRQGDLVVLEGLAKDGPKTAGSVIAQLPEGFRPSKRLIFPGNHHETQVRVDVLPDGSVQYVAGPLKHNWISLSGIAFITTQHYAGLPSGSGGGNPGSGSGTGAGTGKPDKSNGGKYDGSCDDDDEETFKYNIPHGSKWQYDHWGGQCTALWQPDGELWLAINPAATNGTKVWKTQNGDWKKCLNGEGFKGFWDNAGYQSFVMTDDNHIRVNATYDFVRVPAVTPTGKRQPQEKPHLVICPPGQPAPVVPVPAPVETFKYSIPQGSKWQYDPWGGQCTALWQSNGELWLARNPAATNGTCVWKTQNGDWKKCLNGEGFKGFWDNVGYQSFVMIDWNTIRVNNAYNFVRTPAITPPAQPAPVPVEKPAGPSKWSIPEGSKWRYGPWGGLCTALWQSNGELWMARNPAATNGTCVWKTTDGAAKNLLAGEHIQILWDNKGRQDLVVTDINTLTRSGGYKFIREPALPTSPLKWQIQEGSKWQYDPWGGQCTALWQPNGELWFAIDPKATNGTKVWKTQNGAWFQLLQGDHIKVLWDNVDPQDLVITDVNTVTVNGQYHFKRTPAQEVITPVLVPGPRKWSIPEGSKWQYDPWGGQCTALWQKDGELWMALNPASTNGTCVWKTTKGGASHLINGEPIKALWDNKDFQNFLITDYNTITVNGEYHFKRVPAVTAPAAPKWDIPEGSKWQYDPWGGQCTALWQPNGELWLAINPKATDGIKVWKTQNGAANHLLAGEHIKALWDNKDQQDFVITDINTITVNGNYHFRRTPPVAVQPAVFKYNIPEGSKWQYDHWGGQCTAIWQPDGELWLAINPAATTGTKVWKTQNGDWRKTLNGEPFKGFWDNAGYQNFVMTDDNHIRVNNTYDFVRTPAVTPGAPQPQVKPGQPGPAPTKPETTPTPTPATPASGSSGSGSACGGHAGNHKWSIPEGSKWQYDPWGGECTALWQPNGELWLAINPAATNGIKVWKTQDGGAHALLNGETIKALWDNKNYQSFIITDYNTITVNGAYHFRRVPAGKQPAEPKWDIPEGSKWQYDPWGGQCTALWQPNGELWMALNPAATNGTCVWKSTNGDAQRLVAGEHVKILWDNVDRQDLVITDINTITVNGSYHFKRTPPIQNAPSAGSHKWSIPEGSKWRYDPWGGLCTALWQANGELWMARNPAATNGTCVWKTTDGAAQHLLDGEEIKILWDNNGRLDLVVGDINTLKRQGGYKFIREPQLPVPGPRKFDIPEGSKWQYDPWGGVCTALWQPNGELWMALNPAATNGTCVWKTTGGDWLYLLAGEHIKILWDNVGRQDLVITDINTITVNGSYHFKRVPAVEPIVCPPEPPKPVDPVEPAKPVDPPKPVEPTKPDPIPVDEGKGGDGGKTVEKDGYDLINDGGYAASGSTVVKDGIIHITEAVTNQFGGIFFKTIPSSSKNISFSFDFFSGNGNGADGFCFFLADGAKHDGRTLGANGGSLGYLPGPATGVPFAYLGIGFDEYGNFGQFNGGNTPSKDMVIVRGGGNAKVGYKLLAKHSVAPLSMDGGWRSAKIDLDFAGNSTVISINMKWYKDKTDNVVEKEVVVFDHVKVDQADIPKPDTFRIGLAASTGGCTNQHYVKNLKILYRNQ